MSLKQSAIMPNWHSLQFYRKPLHWAILNQHTSVVSILLKAKVDVNCKDIVSYATTLFCVSIHDYFQFSKTPLHYAAANNDYQLLALLIEHDANINLSDGVSYYLILIII